MLTVQSLCSRTDRLFFLLCRRQKTSQSPEQTAAAARRLDRGACNQPPYLIIITGTWTALITSDTINEPISTQFEHPTVSPNTTSLFWSVLELFLHTCIHIHYEHSRTLAALWLRECRLTLMFRCPSN